MTVACQAPLSLGFSRQEYWSGLPFPPPGDLLVPGIELMSLSCLHQQAVYLPRVPPGKLNTQPKMTNVSKRFSDDRFPEKCH